MFIFPNTELVFIGTSQLGNYQKVQIEFGSIIWFSKHKISFEVYFWNQGADQFFVVFFSPEVWKRRVPDFGNPKKDCCFVHGPAKGPKNYMKFIPNPCDLAGFAVGIFWRRRGGGTSRRRSLDLNKQIWTRCLSQSRCQVMTVNQNSLLLPRVIPFGNGWINAPSKYHPVVKWSMSEHILDWLREQGPEMATAMNWNNLRRL